MNIQKSEPQILITKLHYEVLDGMRGVAAVAVVIFHFMEIAIPDLTKNFIAHGYLAVDFFFCLSGFVIAYAYDNRIERIGFVRFLALRLIRLHPLVIIGSVLGLLSFLFDPFVSLSAVYGAGRTILLFITSCFMIPYPIIQERYLNLFHLNAPTWSLFWEYVANIIYALLLVKFKNRLLWILVIIAACLLTYSAHHHKHLSIGWSSDNFWGGGARVFYSFIAGMLIYRSHWIMKSRLGYIPVSLLLFAAFLTPFNEQYNWITEPLIVIFYFPLLVALGAGARTGAGTKVVCNFSGEISYPLYMVHYPFIWIFLSYVEKQKPALSEMTIVTCIGVLLLILFAYLVMRYIDVPIRSYLKRRTDARFSKASPL